MKKLINLTKFALMALMLCVGFVSCSNDDAKPENPFTLSITTEPADAKVLINGKEAKTFTTKTNAAEKITYEVSKEGYETLTGEHNVTKTETIKLELKKSAVAVETYTLTITTEPTDAKVVIEGETTNTYTTKDNQAKEVTYEVSKEGYVAVSAKVTITKTETINIVLVKEEVSKELAAVKKDGKWGYINKKGEVKIAFQYLSAEPFANGLAPVEKEKEKWVFIDARGDEKLVLNKEYSLVSPFYGKYAIVKNTDGLAGMITKEGVEFITCSNGDLEPFVGGLARFRTMNNEYGFYDETGKKVSTDDFAGALPHPRGGIAAVRKVMSHQWRFYNIDGTQIGPGNLVFEDVWPFTYANADFYKYEQAKDEDLLAAVKQQKSFANRWGFINSKGETKIELQYNDAKPFSEGLAAVESFEEKKWGFINTKGEIIIPFTLHGVEDYFTGGFAAVAKDRKKYTFIDKTGKDILNKTYDEVKYFCEGVAAVKEGNNWGVINTSGTLIIPTKYEKIINSSQNIIIVQENEDKEQDKKMSFFDHSAKQIGTETFEDARYFTAVDEELPYWTRNN